MPEIKQQFNCSKSSLYAIPNYLHTICVKIRFDVGLHVLTDNAEKATEAVNRSSLHGSPAKVTI